MSFSTVFDVQTAYRKVIKAFSFPGEIESLGEEADKIEYNIGCYSASQIFMHMLLDSDTKFYVESKDANLYKKFAQITYSIPTDIEKAEYIFITEDSTEKLAEIIEKAHIGDLENPHKGTTIIVESGDLSNNPIYKCSGCGIKNINTIDVKVASDWIDARSAKNHQFPMGIDIVFVDKTGKCIALPRTTRVERA